MTDLLRYLRLGMINIMGITIPGLLTLVFLLFGFILPLFYVISPLNEVWFGQSTLTVDPLLLDWFNAQGGGVIFTIFLFVLAYVTGYIIRLSSPDELDKVSAKQVLKKMAVDANNGECENAEEDHWPYRGAKDDKFPYHHFKDYLIHRNLPELADLVKWDSTKAGKRTKTHINMMKLEVATTNPDLSATIEANEAHVRLMFGTWLVTRICIPLTLIGSAISLAGLLLRLFFFLHDASFHTYPYIPLIFGGLLMSGGMYWAKNRIEKLFHYQRVRELMYIVGCAYYAKSQNKQPPA